MDQDFRRTTQRRDFTREVISARPPATPPRPPASQVPKLHKNKQKKWLRLMLINLVRLAVIVVIVLAGSLAWRHFIASKDLIPKSIQQSVGFTIYIPNPVASGYKLDKSLTKLSSGILFYTIDDKTGLRVMNVTIQAAPSGFNPAEHLDPSIKPSTIPIGKLFDDTTDQTVKFIIVPRSNDEIIFISGQNIGNSALKDMVDNLKPLSN